MDKLQTLDFYTPLLDRIIFEGSVVFNKKQLGLLNRFGYFGICISIGSVILVDLYCCPQAGIGQFETSVMSALLPVIDGLLHILVKSDVVIVLRLQLIAFWGRYTRNLSSLL